MTDLFLGLIKPDAMVNRSADPIMYEWLMAIPSGYIICWAICVFFTLITVTLSVIHLYFVFTYISEESIQTDLYWLVFLAPIVSLCGTVGMIVPKAATFLYAVALVYFMTCIFVTVTLMTTLTGGRVALCKKLLIRNKRVNMQILPLGCCCFWLPKLKPTEKVFRRIEWLVFQSPILRVFLEILNLVVYMETGTRLSPWFSITNVMGIVSLFVASWGSYMIIPMGSEFLRPYRFLFLFRIVDTSQLIYSIQKIVFDFCAGMGFFGDNTQYPTAKAQYWMCFLLTVEMFIVSLMSTFAFQPSKTAFFDKFTRSAGPSPPGIRAPIQESPSIASLSESQGRNPSQ